MAGTVAVRSLKNLQMEVRAGRHTFIADEPEESGRQDAGPDPYALLLASLGT